VRDGRSIPARRRKILESFQTTKEKVTTGCALRKVPREDYIQRHLIIRHVGPKNFGKEELLGVLTGEKTGAEAQLERRF